MNNRNTLTTLVLILSCIRVLSFLISYIGLKVLGNNSVNEFLNAVYYTGAVMNIAITLFFAYALSLIKENSWRSMAFIFSAFMIAVFLMAGLFRVSDPNIFKALGAVNLLMLIFFIVQSFLIKNQYFKNAFRIYSITILLMVILNSAIPYILYKMALPMSSIRSIALVNIIPAIVECYIVYLFQQYFNSPAQYLDNDLSSDL